MGQYFSDTVLMSKYLVNDVPVIYVTKFELHGTVFFAHRPSAPSLKHMWAISVEGVELEIQNVKTKQQLISKLRKYAKKIPANRFNEIITAEILEHRASR